MLTIDQIAESLQLQGGFISRVATALNVTPSAISQRVKKSRKLQRIRREVEEKLLDMAETQLIKKINKGDDLGAICFYLKCKGKDRGYVERQELVTPKDEDFNITVKIED